MIDRLGLSRWIPAAVLLLLCGAFFHPLLNGKTFTTVAGHHAAVYPWRAFDNPYTDAPQSDQADLTYPWRSFIGRELARGTVPFWNPYSFGGQPFFANGSSGILYPPNLLTSLTMGPDRAHDVVSVFHVLCSGIFMFLLMRHWQARMGGALVAATAWMLAAFNMAWLHLEVVAPVATWLPAGLWLASRAIREGSWRWAIGAVAALTSALMAGHLLFGGVVFGVVVVYAAGLTASRLRKTPLTDPAEGDPQRRVSTALRLVAITVGPFLLGGVVLVPTLVYLASLQRVSIGYEAVHESVRVPFDVFRHLLTPPPPPLTERTMHGMVYLGVLPPLLAVIGLVRQGPGRLFAVVMIVGAFCLATDVILLRLAYAVFPPVSFFSPLGRLLNLFNFGVAVLAGFGFDVITGRLPRGWSAWVAAIVIGITGWQLVAYARLINPPFVPREPRWLYPATPLIEALSAQGAVNGTRPGRVLPLRHSQLQQWTPPVLYAAESLVFGIDSIGGYDSTLPPRAETALRVASGEDLDATLSRTYRRAFVTSFEVDRLRFHLLPRLGVTTLVTPPGVGREAGWDVSHGPGVPRLSYAGPDGEIYQLDSENGGPWLVHAAVSAASADDAARHFIEPAFDPRHAVILEELVDTDSPPGTDEPSHVEIVEDGINTMRAIVNASRPGWLVLPIVWERGWRATVNGSGVRVMRANYLYQAVAVPAGNSRIELEYVPSGLAAGAAATGLSVATAAGLFVRGRMRRRRSVGAVPASARHSAA